MSPVVPLVDVDIANLALGLLGISNGITSLDPPDKTEQAKAAAFHLPKIRDWLLQSAPWNFADTYIALAADASNVPGTQFAYPGWRYAYQYPNDCLQPVAISTQAGLRFGPLYFTNHFRLGTGVNFAVPKIPYKIFQSTAVPGQLAIATDIPNAYLFYIASVDNYALWDPMATQALSAFLAQRMGGSLRTDGQKVSAAGQMGADLRLQAMAQHMNAAQQDPAPPSPSVSVRW